MSSTKEIVSTNAAWRIMERVGAQLVTFVVSIVLARILDPTVYGQIALTTIFITFMNVFVDSGLGTALIQKKDADDIDFSTVFYFNIVFCILLYVVLFLVAPLIAVFYDEDNLTSVLRVLGILIIISGVKNIQIAYVSRNMMFKKFFFATLGGTIGASVLGIWMALKGFGIWSLVAQTLFNNLIDTIILWFTVKWRPKFVFSFERLKVLFSFGWKLLIAKLIDTIYEDARSLIIGKKYSADDLAYYNRAKQMPQLIITTINSAADNVLLSSLSKEQDNEERLKLMTARSIKIMSYIVMPMMIGLACCSSSVINVLLTSKWSEAIPYMQIFCLGFAIVPISLIHLNVIKAKGDGALYLKLEITRKVIMTFTLLISMWFGVMAIAISYLINCLITFAFSSIPNIKLIKYKYSEQLRDLFPAFALSLFMGMCVYSINYLNLQSWLALLIQVTMGVMIYLGGSILFKIDSFFYVVDIVKNLAKKRLKK